MKKTYFMLMSVGHEQVFFITFRPYQANMYHRRRKARIGNCHDQVVFKFNYSILFYIGLEGQKIQEKLSIIIT